LQSDDDDDLMEVFQRHHAELRREHAEYEDAMHKLECEIAGLHGRVDQLEEVNKRLADERDQFLERYYRLVTQFEPIGAASIVMRETRWRLVGSGSEAAFIRSGYVFLYFTECLPSAA
jgi:predicted nuclease with TOPRIM domain